MSLRRLLARLLHGSPPKRPDFVLPSAEGQWGYPTDLLEQPQHNPPTTEEKTTR